MKIVLATLHVRPSAQSVALAAGCLVASLPEELRGGCVLLDLYPEDGEEASLEKILGESPQMVAFPLYCWNRVDVLALARRIRERQPDTVLVCGGPEATPTARETLLEGELDGVILGEGEGVFAALVEALSRGEASPSLPGLVWKGPAVEPTTAAPTPLAELPSPWLAGVLAPNSAGGVLWETSRGCIYGCAYCFDARGVHGVRHLPYERLAAELELFASRGVSQVWVLDSTFNAPPQRGKELLRLLAQHAPGLHYHLEARAELLDAETVELLSHLDCSVQLGLQSLSSRALKILHRHVEIDGFEHACRLLNQQGVTFGIDLIYGLPGDTHDGFVRTLDFALAQRPNQLDIFPLAVLPGTELSERRKELNILAMQSPPYLVEMLPDYAPRELRLSRELAEACNLLYNRGRAVGFFSSLLEICELPGSALLSAFRGWLAKNRSTRQEILGDLARCTMVELLQLQLDFSADLLASHDKEMFTLAMNDLIRFHFHYAECLLGAETPPNDAPPPELGPTERFRLVDSLRLIDFSYEIQDLLDMEADGLDLEAFVDLFTPVGSTALFIKREGEVACESLSDDFALLLKGMGARGGLPQAPVDLPADEVDELLTVAWGEGLIERATAEAAGP